MQIFLAADFEFSSVNIYSIYEVTNVMSFHAVVSSAGYPIIFPSKIATALMECGIKRTANKEPVNYKLIIAPHDRCVNAIPEYFFLLFEPKNFFFALRHVTHLIHGVIPKANLQMLQS